MKQLLPVIFCLSLFTSVFAQTEELSPLGFNPAQYHAAKKHQPAVNPHRYLIDKGITVVNTNTLSIPFVDDFTKNSLATVGWNQTHITDTFYNVYGTCLAVEGITLIQKRVMNNTSWSYSFDTLAQRVDSVAYPSDTFTFFGPATSGCFNQTPQNMFYWREYYTYTFDSATGRPVDSVLVEDETNHPSSTLYYAPVVYFAQGQTDNLWFDNYAYVNNTYPVNPPTIGVATLDGLNEYGLPYNNINNHTYGTADYLTSKPIDLSGLVDTDSLYLSFFYEAQGLGDYPDKDDSLILEFRDNSSEWRTVWHDTGFASSASVPLKFKEVLVQVPALVFPYTYYYSTFQFRFRNKASLYGNNDHWHLDYVILDKNRSAVDTIIQDIAFVYPLQTILKNFTLMPADQFSFPADLRDSVVVSVHNMDPNANNNPPATNFVKGANELYPTPVVVAADLLQTFNAAEYSYIQVNPSSEYVIPNTPNWPVDSLVIASKVTIDPNDSRSENDTLTHTQHFDYTLAYDDGSAELAYGVTGIGTKKFAYEFVLNQPDTLTAFQVQFSQVEENVSDLVFNFNAWDSLSLNDFLFDDATTNIFSLDNRKPYYIDSVNGFTTYKLDTPVIISNKIYFGWTQTDTRRLQVGYDLNSTLGRPHMFVNANGLWKPSLISTAGSPMIRLIFDSNFWGGTSAIKDLTGNKNSIAVYPNPTSGHLNIRSENINALFEATVTNMLGEVVKKEQNISDRLNINELQNGIYLLTLRDTQSGKSFHSRVVKTAY